MANRLILLRCSHPSEQTIQMVIAILISAGLTDGTRTAFDPDAALENVALVMDGDILFL